MRLAGLLGAFALLGLAGTAAAGRLTPDDCCIRLMQGEGARCQHETPAPLVATLTTPASSGPASIWNGDAPSQSLGSQPTGDSVLNTPSSLLGGPAITTPLTAVRGLPMGFQVKDPMHDDAQVAGFTQWTRKAL